MQPFFHPFIFFKLLLGGWGGEWVSWLCIVSFFLSFWAVHLWEQWSFDYTRSFFPLWVDSFSFVNCQLFNGGDTNVSCVCFCDYLKRATGRVLKRKLSYSCSYLCGVCWQVALVYPNNDPISFICAFYGCVLAGVVPVPVEVPLSKRVGVAHVSIPSFCSCHVSMQFFLSDLDARVEVNTWPLLLRKDKTLCPFFGQIRLLKWQTDGESRFPRNDEKVNWLLFRCVSLAKMKGKCYLICMSQKPKSLPGTAVKVVRWMTLSVMILHVWTSGVSASVPLLHVN